MLHLVINLDDSIERMESVAAKLSALNISFERVSAVNGRSLTDMEFTNLVYPLDHFDSKVRFTRQLTRGEVGCFLSHIKCWQKLLASDEDWALIMEDDIQISDFAPRFMKSTDWIPNGIQMCQLSCLYRTQDALIDPFDKIELDLGYSLVRPLFPHPLGTQCYLISRDAASKALQLSKSLLLPSTIFYFHLGLILRSKIRYGEFLLFSLFLMKKLTLTLELEAKSLCKRLLFLLDTLLRE